MRCGRDVARTATHSHTQIRTDITVDRITIASQKYDTFLRGKPQPYLFYSVVRFLATSALFSEHCRMHAAKIMCSIFSTVHMRALSLSLSPSIISRPDDESQCDFFSLKLRVRTCFACNDGHTELRFIGAIQPIALQHKQQPPMQQRRQKKSSNRRTVDGPVVRVQAIHKKLQMIKCNYLRLSSDARSWSVRIRTTVHNYNGVWDILRAEQICNAIVSLGANPFKWGQLIGQAQAIDLVACNLFMYVTEGSCALSKEQT